MSRKLSLFRSRYASHLRRLKCGNRQLQVPPTARACPSSSRSEARASWLHAGEGSGSTASKRDALPFRACTGKITPCTIDRKLPPAPAQEKLPPKITHGVIYQGKIQGVHYRDPRQQGIIFHRGSRSHLRKKRLTARQGGSAKKRGKTRATACASYSSFSGVRARVGE